MLTVELEPIIPASKWAQTHSLDCMASGIRRGFSMGMYEGESKSKGKKRVTALTEVTVSNYTYHFST
jgi:hypothetical protein